jgi:hypothetical protein
MMLTKNVAAVPLSLMCVSVLLAGCSADSAQEPAADEPRLPAVDKADLGSALSRLIYMGPESNDGSDLCFADGVLEADLSLEAQRGEKRVP